MLAWSQAGFKCQIPHKLVIWSWTNYLASLNHLNKNRSHIIWEGLNQPFSIRMASSSGPLTWGCGIEVPWLGKDCPLVVMEAEKAWDTQKWFFSKGPEFQILPAQSLTFPHLINRPSPPQRINVEEIVPSTQLWEAVWGGSRDHHQWSGAAGLGRVTSLKIKLHTLHSTCAITWHCSMSQDNVA